LGFEIALDHLSGLGGVLAEGDHANVAAVDRGAHELGDFGGPLYNVAYPKPERWTTFVPNEVKNFVADNEHMPAGLEDVIIHRYTGKILYLTTSTCLGHCQYCFRPDIAGAANQDEGAGDNLSPHILDRICAYLEEHPRIREVILSGGDPLTCEISRLEYAVQRLTAVPSVKSCRLHTRAPAYAPQGLTDRFIRLLEHCNIHLVIHAVHPYELDAEAATPLLAMRRRGIMMYNQFPLIRGINDHPGVIMELGYRCTELGVHMLSMFIADPIKFCAAYRVRLQRVFDIADEIFFHGEAWLSNMRVCQDTPIGKVKREHILPYAAGPDQHIFRRQGRSVTYQDIPRELDNPTPLSRLLYAGTAYADLSLWPERYYGHERSA